MSNHLIPIEQIRFELAEMAEDLFRRVQGDHAEVFWAELQGIFEHNYSVTSWSRLAAALKESNEKQA